LIDSEFSLSLPIKTKASACLDALCQAIESYWSVSSTAQSKTYAIKAIKMISLSYIAYISGSDMESRDEIAQAANYAGKAINITKTTAPHAISYTLTSKFDVPHGHAVALCIREFFKLNVIKSEGDRDLQETMNDIFLAMGVDGSEQAKNKINSFMKFGDLETSFLKLGVLNEESINLIVAKVNTERLMNHPVCLSESDIRSVILNG
jgi:alcohol dehydrogenase class IV